ncbi:FAD-dependent monooxygenase [Nocardioides sp.]|uniref:FAD-dependent monooxygenase n=1 Tax=Nocardioides sp. TaxID=35761 RepID=UPI0039E301EE
MNHADTSAGTGHAEPTGEIDVDVLIVGAGPVGLMLALDLGSRGVPCLLIDRIVDQPAGIREHPRAAAIAARTMEFCRRWGLADAVRGAGFPEDFAPNETYCTTLDGYPLFVVHAPSALERDPIPFSPETRERCPQIWFDPILESGLEQYPSVVKRRGWSLESFEDLGSAVRAVVREVDSGREHRVRCRYLVGCDGPGSSVRKALDIGVTGRGVVSNAVNVILEMPNFLSSHDMGPAERYYFLDDGGTWAILSVIDGREKWRFTLNSATGLGDDDCEAAMRRAFGPKVEFSTAAKVEWRRTEAVADAFRAGRVFLAGDAAHTMPPDLGMGMNTGVADSVNLGWKLEAALAGWGGERLLDSYEIERRPIAVHVAGEARGAHEKRGTAARGQAHVLEDSPRGEAARRAIGARLAEMFPGGWDTSALEFGYQYDESPVTFPDGTPRPAVTGLADYTQTARPGARAPHAWLPDGRSTLDLFGHGFALLRIEAPDVEVRAFEEAADLRGVPLTVHDIDSPEVRALYESPLVLVRPDGHVAWRGATCPDARDSLDIIDRLRGAAS